MITFRWFWRCIHHNLHFRRRWPFIQHHRGLCLCDVNEVLRK